MLLRLLRLSKWAELSVLTWPEVSFTDIVPLFACHDSPFYFRKYFLLLFLLLLFLFFFFWLANNAFTRSTVYSADADQLVSDQTS